MVTSLADLFDDAARARINEAITEAERGTSAEIVPVVADASGAYDRPEDLFGLTLALAVLAAAWTTLQGVDPGGWSSATMPALMLGLPSVLGIVLGTFFAGVALASRSWTIRALFTPRSQMRANLERGAARAFTLHGLGDTRHGTGVLIYVSLFERMVYVLGDREVRTKLGDEDFAAVKDAIVAGFRKGEATDALVEGIRLAGERLAAEFPAAADDVDELPNEVVLLPYA